MLVNRADCEFIDNGNCQEFFVSGLQDVEVMGSVSRLIWYVLRRSPGGAIYREACFSCIIPNEVITQALAIMAKADGTVAISAATQASKLMM